MDGICLVYTFFASGLNPRTTWLEWLIKEFYFLYKFLINQIIVFKILFLPHDASSLEDVVFQVAATSNWHFFFNFLIFF